MTLSDLKKQPLGPEEKKVADESLTRLIDFLPKHVDENGEEAIDWGKSGEVAGKIFSDIISPQETPRVDLGLLIVGAIKKALEQKNDDNKSWLNSAFVKSMIMNTELPPQLVAFIFGSLNG